MAKKKRNANRVLGHNAERLYANKFRELGYERVKTSRYSSRLHDDAGIDLTGIDLRIQIKAGKQTGLNPVKEIKYVQDRTLELFGEDGVENAHPVVLIHHKKGTPGKRRTDVDSIVSLTFEDFIKILTKYKKK